MALMAIRKLNLQTRSADAQSSLSLRCLPMRLVLYYIDLQKICLHICWGEVTPNYYAISTIISWAGSLMYYAAQTNNNYQNTRKPSIYVKFGNCVRLKLKNKTKTLPFTRKSITCWRMNDISFSSKKMWDIYMSSKIRQHIHDENMEVYVECNLIAVFTRDLRHILGNLLEFGVWKWAL